MIAIQVGSEYLDLLPTTKVNFKLKSDFFEQNEKAVSSHTLPFDVPRTSQNERIFQYVSLSEIENNEALHECQIYLYNLPWKKGTIEILSWEKGTYKITVFVELSNFLLKMEDSLRNLDLPQIVFNNATEADTYFANSLLHTWTDGIVFPEMFAPNFVDIIGYQGFINSYIESNNAYADFINSFHVPFLFVRYVLEKIQEFCNCQIEGDFMTNPELLKMLIVNNYTIYLDNKINFRNHLPDISIRAFIAQLADILNYAIEYNEVENKIIFVKKDSIFELGNYQDFSNQFCEHISGEIVNTQTKYQISFLDEVFPTHPIYQNQTSKIEKIELGASTLQTFFETNLTTSKIDSNAASLFLTQDELFKNIGTTSENNLRFVFWHGLQPNPNGSAPQSTHYTPLVAPTIILDPLELYNNQFIKFIKAKEETKKYDSEFLFTVTDILNFDINKPIRINSVTFVPTEASINITLQGVEPVKITQFRI